MTQHLKSPDRKPSSKLWVPLAGAAALIVAGAVVFSIVKRGGAEPGSAATGAADADSTLRSSADIGKALGAAQTQLLTAVVGQSPLTPAETGDRLAVVFDALEQSSERIPRETFDPRAVVNAVGTEPARLLEWVRGETRLVPYAGLLRGPVGVLQDRFGNSLDRALLLAELLRVAGHDVTLARTAVGQDVATALLTAARSTTPPAPANTSDPTQPIVDGFLNTYAQKFGGNADDLRRGLTAVEAVVQSAGRSAAQRVASQSADLIEVLKGRISTSADDDRELAALADHWFVRYRANGDWIDLDPSGVAGKPGTLVGAVETIAPGNVPEELRHRVVLRVMIECACNGRLEEREVLTHDFRMTETIGAPVTLQQLPSDLPDPWTQLAQADPRQSLRTTLEAASSWSSVLVVGSQTVAQKKFTIAGDVLAPGDALPKRDGGAVDMFGGALGGGGETPGQLTAEFIEYQIHVPGRPVRIERRTLFDWIGAERRAQSSAGNIGTVSAPSRERLMEAAVSTDILLLGQQPSPAFAAKQEAQALLAIRGYVLEQLRSASPKPPGERTTPFPGALFALALAREAWSDSRGSVAIGEPNILTLHYGYRPEASQVLTGWSAFDVVANRVEALDATHAGRFARRLAQGVLDTNAEAILAGGRGISANVAEVMSASEKQGWRATPVSGQDGLVSVSRPASQGAGAEAPEWWRIDVATGDTLGIDARGWGGQAMVEYLKIVRIPVTFIAGVACMYSQAGRPNQIGRQLVCAAGAMLTINGFIAGGVLGQVLPMIGALVGVGAVWVF